MSVWTSDTNVVAAAAAAASVVADVSLLAASALDLSAVYAVSTAWICGPNCDFASLLTASKSLLTVVSPVSSELTAPEDVRLMFVRSLIEPLRVSTELHTAGLLLPPQPTSEAPRSRDANVSARGAFMSATLLPTGLGARPAFSGAASSRAARRAADHTPPALREPGGSAAPAYPGLPCQVLSAPERRNHRGVLFYGPREHR